MIVTPLLALLWRPFYSPLYLFAGAVLLGALAVYAYARTLRGHPILGAATGLMRLLLIVAVAVLLMGPSILPRVLRRPGRPAVTIMLDTSASMQTKDIEGMSRFDFAVSRWLNPDRLAELSRDFNVSLVGFDEAPRPITAVTLRRAGSELAVARVSNIARSVSQTLTTLSNSAAGDTLLVLSDGRDTHDEAMTPVAQAAAGRAVAIHAVALGQALMQRDVALAVLPMQEFLFVNERGQLTVRVLQTNAGQIATTLHLRCGDLHLTRPVDFQGRSDVTVTLPIEQSEPGLYEYEVSVDAAPGEIEVRNNRQGLFMEVVAERMCVLILEGEPYWDTKFLAQSLRKDDRIALTQISQVMPRRPPEVIVSRLREDADAGAAQVPETLEDLAAYDVIVLGRGIERILSPEVARLLPEYVSEHGGRVVFARGRAYDPTTPRGGRMAEALAVLEPAVWGRGVLEDQKLALAPAGQAHPSFAFAGGSADQTLSQLPGLTVIPIVGREKPAAQVLARTRGGGSAVSSSQPVLLSMPYGRGVVVALLGEGLWRWSLLPAEAAEVAALTGAFDQFWSNMIRWLALGSDFQPGQKMTLRLSRRSLPIGEWLSIDLASRFQTAGEVPARLTIVDPLGQQHEPALRAAGNVGTRRQAQFQPEKPGLYRVTVESPLLAGEPLEARFSVYDIDFERLLSATNRGALRQLAVESGGLLLNPAEPEKLPDLLRRYRASTLVPPRPRYVWDRAWIMTLILLWGGCEWLIRRKGGLL